MASPYWQMVKDGDFAEVPDMYGKTLED